MIPIIFSIYCNENFKLIAYCNELFYNLLQWQTTTKISLQWSDINYFTIYCYNRYDVIIYYNKDIVAVIWSKLFVPIIWSKLFVPIICNLLQWDPESNSLLLQHIHSSKLFIRFLVARWTWCGKARIQVPQTEV